MCFRFCDKLTLSTLKEAEHLRYYNTEQGEVLDDFLQKTILYVACTSNPHTDAPKTRLNFYPSRSTKNTSVKCPADI